MSCTYTILQTNSMFIQHKSGQNPVSTHRQCY
nr:MAG TPA: hypothetical protein [Caudoviricetes sp.]